MPITNASFSVTESLAYPQQITLTDTSTGSDAGLTSRRITILLANGNWLTEDGESETEAYTTWPIGDTSITLDILEQSTAADITVGWYTNSTRTYVAQDEFCFNLFDYITGLQLLQGNTSAPDQVTDTTFYMNMIQYIVNIFNEENAIEYGADIYSSQGAMNRNNLFITNQAFYF